MTFKMVTCTRVDSESSAGHELSSVQAWLIDLVQDIKISISVHTVLPTQLWSRAIAPRQVQI
jgi:hypothetical protein